MVRAGLVTELEGAAKDLSALLETAQESDADRLRCKACGSFIPGVSKLKLGDILAVIRELRAVLPAQLEHEGLPPIQVKRGGGRADRALQTRRRMTREGLTTAFEATARHITESHVIDPSMLLEHLRRYWPLR